MKPRTAALVAAIGLAMGLGGIVAWYVTPVPTRNTVQESAADAPIDVGGPFTLVAHDGKTVTEQSFAGEFLLVFFGYVFCPDVCPTTLAEVSRTLDLLGDDAARIQPLFITVDPARDTPQALADYVAHFHPRIVGLTGTPEQIAAVAKAYRVYYAKAPGAAESDSYLMDHSAFVYLIAPDGSYVTAFSYQTPPEEMAEAIRGYLREKG
jgi:protein SCO1/2